MTSTTLRLGLAAKSVLSLGQSKLETDVAACRARPNPEGRRSQHSVISPTRRASLLSTGRPADVVSEHQLARFQKRSVRPDRAPRTKWSAWRTFMIASFETVECTTRVLRRSLWKSRPVNVELEYQSPQLAVGASQLSASRELDAKIAPGTGRGQMDADDREQSEPSIGATCLPDFGLQPPAFLERPIRVGWPGA